MNQKSKKPAKREGAKKRLNRWEREALNPEVREVSMDIALDEQGNVYPVPLADGLREREQVKTEGREAEFLNRLGRARRANRQFDKGAAEAMSHLLAWAIMTGQCVYGEQLTPDDQIQLLNIFDEDVEAGIKRVKFEKRRYDTTDQAYLWIKPKMIRFRKKHGIPNDKRFTQKLSKEFWMPIKRLKRWQRLVKQHGGNEEALRRGVNRCWDEECKKNAGVSGAT